jgi:outer membrane beta-barrel protein
LDTARSLGAALLALAVLAPEVHADMTQATCVDEEIADRMAYKRKRRGRIPRTFVKAQRHELSATGGYYISDLFSATYVVGGSYTYHMTEDTAVEGGFSFTHIDADVVRAVEDGRAVTIRDVYKPMYFLTSSLLWYPFHGKFQLGGSVVHFDFHLNAGVGVVTSDTSRGVSGVFGLGFKFFTGKAVAWRIDVRDNLYGQELLEAKYIVNDVSVTAGMSLFLPFGF